MRFRKKRHARANDRVSFRHESFLVPRSRYPFGLRQGLRPLVGPYFWACAEYSFCVFQPIRFAIFDNESVNRGVLVLEAARSRFLAQTRRIAASGVDNDMNSKSVMECDCLDKITAQPLIANKVSKLCQNTNFPLFLLALILLSLSFSIR